MTRADLTRLRKLRAELGETEERILSLMESMERITATCETIRGGSRQDKFAAYAARMESLERRRDSLMRRIRRLERAVEEWIRMQPRETVRECLRLRHIEGLAWRKIARRMQYSLPAVRKMEQVALKKGRKGDLHADD